MRRRCSETKKRQALAWPIAASFFLSLALAGTLPGMALAADGVTPLAADVWTNMGGQGPGAAGGTYRVGEETVIYLQVNIPCQVRLTIMGPSSAIPSQVTQSVNAGTYPHPIGVAEETDVGQWQIVLEAAATGQYASDRTSFAVISGATRPPTPAPAAPPAAALPPPSSFDVTKSTELSALMALKMAQGSLPVDLNFDVNGDHQVTTEDARLILQYAVKGQKAASTSQQPGSTGVAQPDAVAAEDKLLGKWQVTRLSLEPPPNPVPEFLVNLIIDKEAEWEIVNDQGQSRILYGGRDTWYKKTLLGNGITEGATTGYKDNKGAYVFETTISFFYGSLPFPFNMIIRGISEIKGSLISKIHLTVSPDDSLDAAITVSNVSGTYRDSSGQKPINFAGGRITYKGFKKN